MPFNFKNNENEYSTTEIFQHFGFGFGIGVFSLVCRGRGGQTKPQAAEKIISFAEDANKTFSGPSPQTKKTILSALGSNLILKDKILHVDMDSALSPIKLISFPSI